MCEKYSALVAPQESDMWSREKSVRCIIMATIRHQVDRTSVVYRCGRLHKS